MEPQKNNAGAINNADTVKGFHSFDRNYTQDIKEIAKMLREERLRRDNAALRLPPLACGCRDPLRCRCRKGGR